MYGAVQVASADHDGRDHPEARRVIQLVCGPAIVVALHVDFLRAVLAQAAQRLVKDGPAQSTALVIGVDTQQLNLSDRLIRSARQPRHATA